MSRHTSTFFFSEAFKAKITHLCAVNWEYIFLNLFVRLYTSILWWFLTDAWKHFPSLGIRWAIAQFHALFAMLRLQLMKKQTGCQLSLITISVSINIIFNVHSALWCFAMRVAYDLSLNAKALSYLLIIIIIDAHTFGVQLYLPHAEKLTVHFKLLKLSQYL